MLKKTAIALGILSIFTLILIAQATTKPTVIDEWQYINVLELTWTQPREALLNLMNKHYEKPEGAGDWKFECADGICNPYYMVGDKKIQTSTKYVFGTENKLSSLYAYYDPSFYKDLVRRIETDFTTGGSLTTSEQTLHIYQKDYRNGSFTVEIVFSHTKKLVKFSTEFKLIPTKEDNSDEQIADKGSHDNLYSASVRYLLGYYMLRSTDVNL